MIIPIISYHKNCHFPKANRRWSHRGDLKINSFRSVCSAKYSFDTLYSRPQTPLFSLDLSPAFELCSAFVFGVTFPPFFFVRLKSFVTQQQFFFGSIFFLFRLSSATVTVWGFLKSRHPISIWKTMRPRSKDWTLCTGLPCRLCIREQLQNSIKMIFPRSSKGMRGLFTIQNILDNVIVRKCTERPMKPQIYRQLTNSPKSAT